MDPNLFLGIVSSHREALDGIERLLPTISLFADAVGQAYTNGNKTLWCGNGGSAADAQHIAAEFVGRFVSEREPLPALALHANTSTLTAVANDYGFGSVFAREVRAFGQSGDVFVGLSTSGNSPNVVEAAQTARSLGLKVVALTGADGGELSQTADISIGVPSNVTARIQEMHILIGHMICAHVDALWAERS